MGAWCVSLCVFLSLYVCVYLCVTQMPQQKILDKPLASDPRSGPRPVRGGSWEEPIPVSQPQGTTPSHGVGGGVVLGSSNSSPAY